MERMEKKMFPVFEKGKSLKLLTLTKKDERGKPTSYQIRDLMKKVGVIIRKHFEGGLCVIEMGKGFNLHVHCIVYGPYRLQKELSDEWLKITGDSSIVDIRHSTDSRSLLSYFLKNALTRSRRPRCGGALISDAGQSCV